MARPTRLLALLLQLVGVSSLLAIGAVLMPFEWMAQVHLWLGLGELPRAPIVEYLARSLSAFYALFGALCLVVAANLDRYRPIAGLIGLMMIVQAVATVVIDIVAGMPFSWTIGEGPLAGAFGVAIFLLALKDPED